MGKQVLLFGRESGDAARNNFPLIVNKSSQLAIVAIIKKHDLVLRYFFLRRQRIAQRFIALRFVAL